MIAFADSSSRSVVRHRRWISSGCGEARPMMILVPNLTPSTSPDTAHRLLRNTRQWQFAILHLAYSPRRARHTAKRSTLKSP
jgi:hypothetical protein